MSTRHAIEIPAATLAALRDYAEVRRSAGAPAGAAALVSEERPLSPVERKTLLDSLQWWQDQQALAEDQVRRIAARLRRA
jgi:hypothetical protein